MCFGFIATGKDGWRVKVLWINSVGYLNDAYLKWIGCVVLAYASNGEVAMKPTFFEIRTFSWLIQLITVILLFADIDRGSFLLFKGLHDRLETELFSSKPCILPIKARDISTQWGFYRYTALKFQPPRYLRVRRLHLTGESHLLTRPHLTCIGYPHGVDSTQSRRTGQ